MFAAASAHRHDQSHLLTHHVQMPLPALATLIPKVCHTSTVVLSEAHMKTVLVPCRYCQSHHF